MTWTNAFDVGPCTVKVARGSTVDFDAAMVKGQTADVPDDSYSGLTVSVSSAGVVALNNPSGVGIEDVFELAVFPASMTGTAGARVALPSCGSGEGEASGNGNSYDPFTNGNAAVDLTDMSPLDRFAARPTSQGSSSVSPLIQFTPEIDVAAPPPPCAELGRVTRIYASGYDRAKVHDGRLVRGESRCLVVEFNGAIPAARTITSVTWRCADPPVIVMSNARIQTSARSVAVDVRANWPHNTALKCEATLDNGERYMQLIRLAVTDSPWFDDETANAGGPGTLTAP